VESSWDRPTVRSALQRAVHGPGGQRLVLARLGDPPSGSLRQKVSCRERRRLTPVDQSITVKRTRSRSPTPSLARLSWWSFSRGRRGYFRLGRLDPDEFLHPRDHGDDVELLAGYAGMVSIGQQASSVSALTPPLLRHQGNGPFVAIPLAVIICAVIAFPVTYLLFASAGILLRRNVGGRRQRHVGHRSIAFFGGGTGHYCRAEQYRLHPTEPRHLLGRWFVPS